MQFMLFVATDPEAEPYDPALDHIEEWVADAEARGRTMGDRLRPPEEARVVRVRGTETIVTDGPFTESKEWIAGFDILDCDSIDEAIDIAARHPMARFGRIEVRAFWPFEPEE